MALRLPFQRLNSITSINASITQIGCIRCYSSAASVASAATPATSTTNKQLSHLDPTIDSATGQLVKEQLNHMVATYVRPTPIFQRGKGSWLWDVQGRKYLDFTSGISVNSLGHSDSDIAQIMFDQSQTLVHTSNLYHNPWTGVLSEKLVTKTKESGGMHNATRSFICNSGTEANEAAIKFARKVGKMLDDTEQKVEIVSFNGSFHGRTLGSLSATPNMKYQKPFAPLLPGFKYGTVNDISSLDTLITPSTAGVIIEPIQGEGGINVVNQDFLIALAKRCRQVQAVLIYDEIQCGMSRTGTFWCHSDLPNKEAHPDIITTAKALGNGFPIGATITNDFVASKILTGDHGTTFGGNPLACRIACHILDRLTESDLLNAIKVKGNMFRKRFEAIQKSWPESFTEIRGRGLILGLQCDRDPTPIVTASRERGLLVITAGTNTLRFLPSLVITPEEIEQGLDILEDAIESVLGPKRS